MFYLWILERVAISFAVFIAGACIGTLLPEQAADVVIRVAGFALAVYWGMLAAGFLRRLSSKARDEQTR